MDKFADSVGLLHDDDELTTELRDCFSFRPKADPQGSSKFFGKSAYALCFHYHISSHKWHSGWNLVNSALRHKSLYAGTDFEAENWRFSNFRRPTFWKPRSVCRAPH